MRVCIAGGPKVGKTTLGQHVATEGYPLRSTDDEALDSGWSEQSELVLEWMTSAAPWIVEGVPVIRALRKWLDRHPEGKPCDVLYWRNTPFTERTRGQETLAVQCQHVYDQIKEELLRRGVQLQQF